MMQTGQIEQLKIGFSDFDYHVGGFYSDELIMCAARSGDGKCLKKGTLIIMSDGSMKKVEDIIIGDKVMGINSEPRIVLSISRGIDMLYTIKQNRAQDYTVNSNHILSLKESSNDGLSKNGRIVNISIKDYLKLNNKKKNNLKGYKVGIEFTKKNLVVEPYFLGIWLGDGDKNSQRITSADYEIEDYLFDYANKINMSVSIGDKRGETCYTYRMTGGMKDLLRNIGVLNNKHIPFDYLTSSKEDRLQLLAGILDTDGNVIHNGFEITQKNKELLKQIKWLADSLGFRTSKIKEKICTIKHTGFSGIYYRITIHGQMSLVPTKIERKNIPYISKRIDQTLTGIKVIEDGIGEYYGFILNGDGLFLLEDFTVTHNSAFMLSVLNDVCIRQGKPAVMFSLEMSTHESICRLICQLTGIPYKYVYQGKMSTEEQWKDYREAKERIANSPMFIDDGFGMTVPEIRSKIRKLMEKDIKLVVIDQLEQVKSYEGMKLNEQYDKIAYDIKNLVKEFNVPIILNHQLNRNIMDRRLKNPEPILSDLNQAGEKPADQVWVILHNKDEKGNIIQSKVKVLKNRNGARIEYAVLFLGERMLFSNPAHPEEEAFHGKENDGYSDNPYQDAVNELPWYEDTKV
jgi:replicative DNA helicase